MSDEPTPHELLHAANNDPNRGTSFGMVSETPPELASLDPIQTTIGDASFTLYIAGTGFTDASVIVFAGHDEPTTVDGDVVSTGVDMSMWHGPDTVDVCVRNGSAYSNVLPFTFLPAPEADDVDAEDELEEDIEEAIEDGDAKKVHRPSKTTTRPGKRK